jgi:hypothetical protein
MKDLFISRICEQNGDDHAIRIESERIFDNYDKALDHLKSVFFDKEAAQPGELTYGEIVSQLNDGAEIRSACYDSSGKIIHQQQIEPVVEKKVIYVTANFVPHYAVGDIVAVTGRRTFDKKLGVISGLPPKWVDLTQGRSAEEIKAHIEYKFEAAYHVEFISHGRLTHDHINENEMQPFTGELPQDDEFLQVLSRHYTGKEIIPPDKLRQIGHDSIYLLPVKTLQDIGIRLPSTPPKYTAAALYSPHELVFYEEGVGLVIWDMDTEIERRYRFRGSNDIKIYCHAPYICIVDNRGTDGWVLNADTGWPYEFERGKYHVENCSFPIGFIERDGETLLVRAADWNRLDIIRLSDFTLLTPRELNDDNSIDYFYSKLTVSPDGRHFAMDGWVWQPMESIMVYDVDRFFTEYDKASVQLDPPQHVSGYNWDRPLCWVDNHTIAIGHNPNEGNTDAGPVPSRILLYDISREKVMGQYRLEKSDGTVEPLGAYEYYPLVGSIPFDGFAMVEEYGQCHYEVTGELYYDSAKGWFIGLNTQTGLLIADREGNVIYADTDFKGWQYSPEFRFLYKFQADPYMFEMNAIEHLEHWRKN